MAVDGWGRFSERVYSKFTRISKKSHRGQARTVGEGKISEVSEAITNRDADQAAAFGEGRT